MIAKAKSTRAERRASLIPAEVRNSIAGVGIFKPAAAKNGALATVARVVIAAPGGVRMFDCDTVRPSPFNRTHFDPTEMAELTESVREHGVLQAAMVRPLKAPIGKVAHEIIMGEGRWRAAKATGRKFPAAVREATDLEVLEWQAIENLQRVKLNPIDEATKYLQLRDAYQAAGATRTEALARICERTKKAPSTVAERLALLKLPDEIVALTQRGVLPPSHATALGKVKDPKTINSLAEQVMHPKESKDSDGVMPIRQVEGLVAAAVQREANLAEWQKQEREFVAKGFRVLTPKENLKHLGCHDDYNDHWWVIGDGFAKSSDTCSHLAGSNYRSYKALWKKAPLPILGRLPDMRAVTIYDRELADAMAIAGGKLLPTGGDGGGSGSGDSEREQTRAHNTHKTQFKNVLGAIVKVVESNLDSSSFWRFFARLLVRHWRVEPMRRTAARRGWKAIEDSAIEEMGIGELRALCAEMLLFEDAPSPHSRAWGKSFVAAAELCKVPLPAWDGKDFHASGSGDDDEEP
jgi:ParB/RepB/Spo0J family partition protein